MMFDLCDTCGQQMRDLEDVACDGCHYYFHRRCLNYRVINVEWADTPKAYAFCMRCDDDE